MFELLQERVDYFTHTFNLLQDTSSRLEKEQIVKDIPEPLREDFNYIVECVNGMHPFGFTFVYTTDKRYVFLSRYTTVKDMLIILQQPKSCHDLSQRRIEETCALVSPWADFFEPIVNRTLRLGIGKSLFNKTDITPMLAKKFEGNVRFSSSGYYITEKLDGNRCIAWYDGTKWNFVSRNGKPMHVNFNMDGFDKTRVYDGEVLSPKQVEMSKYITSCVKGNYVGSTRYNDMFSSTSGLINQHTTDKNLVYNVFDITNSKMPYCSRREELDSIVPQSEDVRILPVLKRYDFSQNLGAGILNVLDVVTTIGGEGLMINLGDSKYNNRRCDDLLKLKKVYTIDMRVVGLEEGVGKYEGCVGALTCVVDTDDGKHISCCVGTGLSDEQREQWMRKPNDIVGKIVEVSYFSLSQNSAQRGTNEYSLRFPRLKRVRNDKNITSEY